MYQALDMEPVETDMIMEDDIFSKSAQVFKEMNAFPLSPPLPDDSEFERTSDFSDQLPPPHFSPEMQPFRVKTEHIDAINCDFFPGENETSSMSSESDSGFDCKIEPFNPGHDALHFLDKEKMTRNLETLNHLNDVVCESDKEGFEGVKFRYEALRRLVNVLLPKLKNPVIEHDLTQAERNHLKNIMKDVQNVLETNLVSGVLDERICEYKINFGMRCPLPIEPVYQDNIERNRIYFFKDHAKTYMCPRTGLKKPYALEMEVIVKNEDGLRLNRDIQVRVSLFRVFEGGRMEEVPEFKMEGSKRKRCWGMIKGNVLKGKSRICVKNKSNDKTQSTAIQTLYNGRGTLYGRVEIPATPGWHRWVITPANLSDDIGKALGSDFVVKSKRTTRKRKRDEESQI